MGDAVFVVEGEEVADVADVERGVGLAVHEAEVAGDIGCDFGGREDLQRESFEPGAVEVVESAAQIAGGEEIREHDADATPTMLAKRGLDGGINRHISACSDALDEGEHLRETRAPGAWTQALGGAAAECMDAHFLRAAKTEDTECGGKFLRERELVLEIHRGGAVHEQDDMLLLLVVKLFEVGPVDAREDVPVEKAHVVARRVVAEIAELRARAALRREMLAARPVGEAPRGVQPQPRKAIQIAVGEETGDLGGAHCWFTSKASDARLCRERSFDPP